MQHRYVVLDTETTGLSWQEGHRVIEIGAVEILERRITERRFHCYLNPERSIDAEAEAVHGISLEKLQAEPKFSEIAPQLLAFLDQATLVIHNATFDLGFLNAELARAGYSDRLEDRVAGVIDTLQLARAEDPTKRASLDALCDRYGINRESRTLHGALLDAELLAEVFLAMTRGQERLAMETHSLASGSEPCWQRPAGLALVRIEPTSAERAAHEALLDEIDRASGGKTLWRAGS